MRNGQYSHWKLVITTFKEDWMKLSGGHGFKLAEYCGNGKRKKF